MTSIDFYTHVLDRILVTARLVAKAYAQHGSVRVTTADEEATAALDALMWKWPATAFLPHCRLASGLAAETPIIIDHIADHRGPAAVLVNLQPEPPAFFARFERLAEIVADGDDATAAGRERWKYYKQRGYALRSHDMGERAS